MSDWLRGAQLQIRVKEQSFLVPNVGHEGFEIEGNRKDIC